MHLTMPLAAWLGLSDAPGTIDGVGAADAMTCRDLARALAGRTGTRWCLTITGPDARAVGHACATTGPPQGSSPDGPSPGRAPPGQRWPGGPEWLAGLTIHWLETGDCSHRRETATYRPSPRLSHLVKVRNPTCSAPGCRRRAVNCDDDHTIPYDRGGRTCECNLTPPGKS
ncbi:MAG TPA: hypothetical protein VIJ82_19220 [Streptosporangiaceae bacterium]